MKKVLIVSDSHGNTDNFLEVIEKEKPDYKIHAGDYCAPVSIIEENFDWFVLGNNDFDGGIPKELEFKIEDLNFVLTHGDVFGHGFFGGKKKLDNAIYEYAKNKNADIVITGHTHLENFEKIKNIILLNPGSICLPRNVAYKRSYMIIHVAKDKILERSLKQAIRYLD